MGLVYLARSPGGRLVAVKVIHTHLTDDPGFLRRFRREVEAAKAVSGFYTAPVIDADTGGRPAWLATAHVAGPDLAAVVATRGPLPAGTVTALAAALAEALKAVHAAGLVHRDLKPSNILLADDGPRVIDFGIVRALDGSETIGGLVGTPGYMSPEQADGGEVGPASDVFSLGGVLYFAATGRAPFGTGDIRAVLHRVLSQEPDLTRIPAEQRDFIARCLAKEPSARPGPDEILAELDGLVATAGPADWTAGPQSPLIDEYSSRVASYPGPRPDAPGPVPEPEPEPDPRPERAHPPSRPADGVHRPDGAPPTPTPKTRRPSARDLRRWRRPRPVWVLMAILVLGAAVFVFDLEDLGLGGGFRPWSVDDVLGRAIVSDGLVYVGRTDGVAAYDARTGHERWRSRSGAKRYVVDRRGTVLIVQAHEELMGLDARSGSRRWRIPVSDEGCIAKTGFADRILVIETVDRSDGTGRTRVSALDSATGARRWSTTLGLSSCDDGVILTEGGVGVVLPGKDDDEAILVSITGKSGEVWRTSMGELKGLASDGSNIYTAVSGADGNRIRAYAANTGRQRWDIRLSGADKGDAGIEIPMRATDSGLYLLERETLYAFDTSNGRLRWKYTFPAAPTNFFVKDGTAYGWWDDNYSKNFRTVERTAMSAIDVPTGRRLWQESTDSDTDVAWADERSVYIASNRHRSFWPDDNALIALDARTGQQRWKRGCEVDGIAPGSGILYVRCGRKLEAVEAATGDGP